VKARQKSALLSSIVVAAFLLGGCSQGNGADSKSTSDGAGANTSAGSESSSGYTSDLKVLDGGQAEADMPVASADNIDTQPQPDIQAQSAAALPDSGEHIIKTATLKIEVEKGTFRDSVQEAVGIAGARGGFVLASTVDDKGAKRGSVVIRVPAGAFERALNDAEGLGDVTGQSITGEDVSQEFVDLGSRLRNSEAQERVLLRLYDQASSVADTIRIQREVQGVQLEIEQIKGRLRLLEDKTSLSTITLNIAEAGAVVAEKTTSQGTLARAWENAAGAALAVISAVIVFAGAVFPIAVLLVLLLLAVRLLRPRFSPQG
jgi:hypothetical protein